MMLGPDGNLVLTGFTKNTSDGMTNDVDTLVYDAAGHVVWQRRWTDTAGYLVLAGFFLEPPGVSPVSRYDAAGARLWSTPLTINAEDALSGLTVRTDSAGAVTLAGTVRDVFVGNSDHLAIDSADDAVVTGTSWNGYLSRAPPTTSSRCASRPRPRLGWLPRAT
jgi:hypothetical protein